MTIILAISQHDDEMNTSWETSVSGASVTVGAEHRGAERSRAPAPQVNSGGSRAPSTSNIRPAPLAPVAYPPALSTRTPSQDICDLYFNERAGGLYGNHRVFTPSDALIAHCFGDRSSPDEAAAPAAPTPAELGTYIRDNSQTIINAGTLTFEPMSGDVLINKDVYLSSSARPYSATLNLLNTPVEVQLTPTSYTWDLGNGTAFTTFTPGGPYPHGEARGQYSQPGIYAPSVHIRWHVTIKIGGSPNWYTVPGNAYTTTFGPPLTAVEAEAVLTTNR
ncbi:hypothetical protein J2S70_001638 [Trueperella bonasi]|uniref:PKD domain-containing protein n=1 Tax=Trueperella bonasi TaxID=312286 RepID=A0ABT9NI18_9ACTO|nr:hypothetical protein [Trueperella bonasi]MDP9807056.1 hypothetical protein [Trueperella bonasi]